MKPWVSRRNLHDVWSMVLACLLLAAVPCSGKGSDDGEQLAQVTVFLHEECAHCAKELDFLRRLRETVPFTLRKIDIGDPDDRLLFEILTDNNNLPKGTPITVIGRRILVGYLRDDTSGAAIKRLILSEPAGVSVEEMLGLEGLPMPGDDPVCDVSGPYSRCGPAPAR